ncbi:MAG: hypothetical protein EOM68_00020 [Spirochaetia bacterium]|nr:hypothetical protein [Spirochaetia bacterium]
MNHRDASGSSVQATEAHVSGCTIVLLEANLKDLLRVTVTEGCTEVAIAQQLVAALLRLSFEGFPAAPAGRVGLLLLREVLRDQRSQQNH